MIVRNRDADQSVDLTVGSDSSEHRDVHGMTERAARDENRPALTIALIIVNYRCADLVGQLLDSICRRGKGWVARVIIVDNASGDGSVATLRARVGELAMETVVEVLDSGRNRGFGAGNNIGYGVVRSELQPDLLWFLNPDTLVDDVNLDHALAWFECDPQIGIVGTGLTNGDGERDLGGHREISPLSEFLRVAGTFRVLRKYAVSDSELDQPGTVDWVSGASLIIRRSVFEQIGGFDEGFFLYFEEVDLCRRVRMDGWRVVYEPRIRVMHLEGQSTGVSGPKQKLRHWYESRRRYFLKHFGLMGLLKADLGWGLGRLMGRLRRKSGDGCLGRELWRIDGPVILGIERLSAED